MQYLLARYKYPNVTFLNPIGLSGGLCLLWKDNIELQIIDKNFNMINLLVKLDSQNDRSLVTCLYGALNDIDKTRQWNHIRLIKTTHTNTLIVIGDLNFILHTDEKEGGNILSQSELDNNNMILHNNLLTSMNYISNLYTWTNRRNGNELIIERLDRILTTFDWSSTYPNATLYHLTVVGSDHCPIMLLTSKLKNSNKKPFRVNKAWFRDPSCTNIIKKEWKCNTNGSSAFQLTHCLKNAKVGLRLWNYHYFGNCNTQISNLEAQLSVLTSTSNQQNNNRVNDLTQKLKYWYDVEADYWKQRGKYDSLLMDDRNNAYFHHKANFRRQKTQVESLQNNLGIWLNDRKDIECELLRHFSSTSRSTKPPCPDLFLNNVSASISESDNAMLVAMHNAEDIKKVVFDMKPWTTPRPDGFPPGFYQLMWETVGPDVVKMTKAQDGCVDIKLDMSKAFDRVECIFLIASLKKIGFADAWCSMIEQCISTVSTSILLNGSLGNVFYPQRGLRQGDPLYPYLFILCMEAFSRGLRTAEGNNEIYGFKATKNCPPISHLFFADDFLIFIKARNKDARNLSTFIDQFSKFSGQAINFENSALAFSPKVTAAVKNEIANTLRIKRMSLNEKYLGVPLLLQKRKYSSFVHLLDSYRNRLHIWDSIFLSPLGELS
ncbi:uncharacterized protein LOC113316486 [Papaver somniferum]|uniref:uncharacterized protein LOC113316486 n=1 Tax=Papaver somniferum TaxID=3469 RepID=UPI000E6FB0FE|nr:uncharacterized protein LOC113316486 [Papaver somniferum]